MNNFSPVRAKHEELKQLKALIPAKIKDEMKEWALSQGRSMNWVVNELVNRWMKGELKITVKKDRKRRVISA